MNFLCHDKLLRTINISGSLVSKGRVHIGSGNVEATFEESEGLLIRIHKDGLDLPYIPGSSLKGIFRSTIEYILSSIGEETCFLQRESKCFSAGKSILNARMDREYEENLMRALNRLCLACKMFGGLSYSSNVFISDCLPIDSESVDFDISPGIAINRLDATTMRGALFTLEHINPESQFNFNIRVNNLPNFLVGLLFKVISFINKGVILIGGKKRAGLGSVKITIDKIEISKLDETDTIDYNSIDSVTLEQYKIDKLDDDQYPDYDIIIPSNELKQKSEEEFCNVLINYFMEAWDKYVESKKN